MSLGFRHVLAAACLLALAACSSTDREPGSEADPAGAGAGASGGPDRTSSAPASPGAGATDAGRTARAARPARPRDGSPIVLTGAQLCAAVPAAAAGDALGLRVEAAEAGDTATPQCTYSYANRDGEDSALTLAAARPADIDGRTGLAAFDFMVDLSRELAGPDGVTSVDLPVGDKAVRLSGGGVHTGVVASGGHLLTVTVPARDAAGEQVDTLVAQVARALA